MLGTFLFVGEEILFKLQIFGGGDSPFARAGNRANFYSVTSQPDMHFGGSSDDRVVHRVEDEHVGRRIHGSESTVEVQWPVTVGLGEALGRHDLDDVAGTHVFFAFFHHCFESFLAEVSLGNRDLIDNRQSSRRELGGLCQQITHLLELTDRLVIGGFGVIPHVGIDAEP